MFAFSVLSLRLWTARKGGALTTCLSQRARVCGRRSTRRTPMDPLFKSHLKGCQLFCPSFGAQPRLSHPLPRPAPKAEMSYCNWSLLLSLRLHSQCLECWGRLARPIGKLAAAGARSGPPRGGAEGGALAQD